jgi:hypothetical protein
LLDLFGRRAAPQSLLARSRGQIQALAISQPEKAAQRLAALFKLFELRAGAADEGRLAVAPDIVKCSDLAKPARPRQPSVRSHGGVPRIDASLRPHVHDRCGKAAAGGPRPRCISGSGESDPSVQGPA